MSALATSEALSRQERLAACALVRTRFAGRADLARRAERDPHALLALECALGLRSARSAREESYELDVAAPLRACHAARAAYDAAQRDLVAARAADAEAGAEAARWYYLRAAVQSRWTLRGAGCAVPAQVEWSAAGIARAGGCVLGLATELAAMPRPDPRLATERAAATCAHKSQTGAAVGRAADRAARLQAAYERARYRVRADRARIAPEAPPAPGRIAAEIRRRADARVEAAAREVLASARLRRATHAHSDVIRVVAASDAVGASSTSGSIASAAAGMSRAYCRAAYRVATSTHVWRVSAEHPLRAEGDVVYLSPTVRVRSGRGTSLVVERLRAATRGQRLLWSAS